MYECYQIYENKQTYFLRINHAEKNFAIGSAKGKKNKEGYKNIDITGYKEQIMKVGVDYKLVSNCITV